MPLIDLEIPNGDGAVPGDVRAFLREADRRADRIRQGGRTPAFVPCDFEAAYHVLRGIADTELAPGKLLCEWGSGLGVVACLAAMLDYDASGIEVQEDLVAAARRLASDYELPVEFACASFIPPDYEPTGRFGSLHTEATRGEDIGLAVDDLAIVFAYPWPDEEQFIDALFEDRAAIGALLLTYESGGEFRLRRKAAWPSPR